MGRAARRTAERYFRAAGHAEAMVSQYRRLLARRR